MQTPIESSLWSNPLVRHLAGILAVKLVLLTVLWWAFFRVPEHTLPQQSEIAEHIVGQSEKTRPAMSD